MPNWQKVMEEIGQRQQLSLLVRGGFSAPKKLARSIFERDFKRFDAPVQKAPLRVAEHH